MDELPQLINVLVNDLFLGETRSELSALTEADLAFFPSDRRPVLRDSDGTRRFTHALRRVLRAGAGDQSFDVSISVGGWVTEAGFEFVPSARRAPDGARTALPRRPC